jgi:hypothetical protein
MSSLATEIFFKKTETVGKEDSQAQDGEEN